MVALKGRISVADYDLWKLFVGACSIICSPLITRENILEAHELIVRFNMHLSCHLQQCLRDFGPSHTFWCFGFERMNVVLGSSSTNNHSVEVQLMHRFVDSVQFGTIAQSIEGESEFRAIYDILVKMNKDACGTANSILYAHTEPLMDRNASEFVLKYNSMVHISGTQLPQVLTATEHTELEAISKEIFSPQFLILYLLYNDATQLSFLGQNYGSRKSRLFRSSTIQSHGRQATSLTGLTVGRIEQILTLTIELQEHTNQLTSASHSTSSN